MTITASWWVYFARCSDGTLYTGITTDIKRREMQHNGVRTGGARYTAARRPVSMVYYEESETRSTASKREYRLRKLPKQQKIAMVNTFKEATTKRNRPNGSEAEEA